MAKNQASFGHITQNDGRSMCRVKEGVGGEVRCMQGFGVEN